MYTGIDTGYRDDPAELTNQFVVYLRDYWLSLAVFVSQGYLSLGIGIMRVFFFFFFEDRIESYSRKSGSIVKITPRVGTSLDLFERRL